MSACDYGGSAVNAFLSCYVSIKILVALLLWTKKMGTNEQLVVFVYVIALFPSYPYEYSVKILHRNNIMNMYEFQWRLNGKRR